MPACATLVLANHRPETLPLAHRLMLAYDTIVLEESVDDRFRAMLEERISIEDYLERQDLEYPEFSRRMAVILRERHRDGARLVQIEPFIDALLAIHEKFADGYGPRDIAEGTDLYHV